MWTLICIGLIVFKNEAPVKFWNHIKYQIIPTRVTNKKNWNASQGEQKTAYNCKQFPDL